MRCCRSGWESSRPTSIAMELEKMTTPRPMTHDLLRNLARGLNAVVRKVVVSELRDETFYAVIWMEQTARR